MRSAHPGGKGGGGRGSSFGSRRNRNTRKFTGSNGKRNTGGGGQLDLELDGIAQIPLKNPGKLRMKLKEKDLESTWEKGWKHDVHVTHVVILGKFFHSVRWRH